MQINDLRVQKFNKVANLSSLSSPQILNTFFILQKIQYSKNITCFKANSRNSHPCQLYLTKLQPKPALDKILYLKYCPKIFYLKSQPQSLIIQEKLLYRLDQYLILHQEKENSLPYINQQQAKQLAKEVTQSIKDYRDHQIPYDCISAKNIAKTENGKWELSVVGYLFSVDKDSPQYSIKQIIQLQKRTTFALGCLLFKLVFGFSPIITKPSKLDNFKVNTYLKMLHQQNSQRLLKVYHYTQRILQLSPQCLSLIQSSLSGKMSLTDWQNSSYFKTPLSFITKITNRNKQVMMINSVQSQNYSLIISSIDYKKNHPFQKFNKKYPPSPTHQSFHASLNSLQKHLYFQHIRYPSQILQKQSRFRDSDIYDKNIINHETIERQFFYRPNFDPEQDYPCRQLLKLIQFHSKQYPEKFQDPNCQPKIKLYVYPYAIAFQLLKIQRQQTKQISRKIQKAIDLLYQVSQLNYQPNLISSLHNTQLKYTSFQQLKPQYRQTINELYQHFLKQAMRIYNCKSNEISLIQKNRRKQKGLQYYRLCLKLLQVSLINRKAGYDLNLSRIQTSQKKDIQSDLEALLEKYFPKTIGLS